MALPCLALGTPGVLPTATLASAEEAERLSLLFVLPLAIDKSLATEGRSKPTVSLALGSAQTKVEDEAPVPNGAPRLQLHLTTDGDGRTLWPRNSRAKLR